MTKHPKDLFLRQMEVGPMANFIYFIGDATTKQVAVVDPAWDVDYLCAEAHKDGLTIACVLLTHGHPDHVNGLNDILSRHNVPAYISTDEAEFYKPKHKNIIEVKDRQKLKIGNIELECLRTPGHTPGGICFKYHNILITGDTLFVDGCGRCDLPGGNAKDMYKSLYTILLNLPDNTLVYPGHNYGPVTFDTIGGQKKTNPYLTCADMDEFLQGRMGFGF